MYALELCKEDILRVIIRVSYGYYVVERVLINCKNELLINKLRSQVFKSVSLLGGQLIRKKWLDMLDKSARGLLHLNKQISEEEREKD